MNLLEQLKTWTSENFWDKLLGFLPELIAAALILAVGFWLAKLVGKLLTKGLIAKNVDAAVQPFIRNVVELVIKFGVILSALSTLGINLNSFITALGAAGVTAGIGLKDSIAQFASGLQILITKPFKSGDFIELETVSGTVAEITFMNTTLNTIDNKRIIIPNSHLTTNNIINYTAEHKRRLDLSYSISYSDDIALAKRVLHEIVEENAMVLNDPAPVIGVKAHDAHAIELACLIWCRSDDYWPLFYEMQETVKLKFDENGITIPYEQLDVHVVSREA
ncbi:MAG TPA: mechanosensitive ion channel [Candidatus Fimivicinus intestinavium]|mgnify:CR=1 FL=1|nr:mechanosensitive ion channel [Candidatus Fimivicinus intestinavium]